MLSKISCLPREIREQLNRRLAQAEPASTLLPWLNSLPETKAALAQHFHGQPITKSNLSDYRKTVFRRWECRQDVLQFATTAPADHAATAQVPHTLLLENLVNWSAARLAASAQTNPIPEDPEAERHELRSFISDVVALRRGDLSARRLAIEQQRLALMHAKSQAEIEALFQQWIKSPDLQPELHAEPDPGCLI